MGHMLQVSGACLENDDERTRPIPSHLYCALQNLLPMIVAPFYLLLFTIPARASCSFSEQVTELQAHAKNQPVGVHTRQATPLSPCPIS